MKKIVMILMGIMLVPCLAFSAITLGDGSSIADSTSNPKHPLSAISLSPNVTLNYAYVDAENYALTGFNSKGSIVYGVVAGDASVYQADAMDGTTDNTVKAKAASATITGWDEVGKWRLVA